MQTIGKYVAVLILALTSSLFGPSEDIDPKEKEIQVHRVVIKQMKCTADLYDQKLKPEHLV